MSNEGEPFVENVQSMSSDVITIDSLMGFIKTLLPPLSGKTVKRYISSDLVEVEIRNYELCRPPAFPSSLYGLPARRVGNFIEVDVPVEYLEVYDA